MYADQNLEALHRCLAAFEQGLACGVCRDRELYRAGIANYGVLINAKDAGLDQLATAATVAGQALEDLNSFCRAAALKSNGKALVAAQACAREYARLRDMIVYGLQ